MNDLSALLTTCLVEVWQGNVFRGTGFFVADQQILTCAHVVDPKLGPVQVRWKGIVYAVTVLTRIPAEGQGPRFYELPDVALLAPDQALVHPAVLLGHSLQGTLRSMGYVLGSVLPRPGVDSADPGVHSVLVELVGPSGDTM